MKKKIYLIVPCYNEEEIIIKTASTLKEKLNNLIKKNIILNDSKILFINDGSNDRTLDLIKKLVSKEKVFMCINLTCNVGHQNALFAGLMYSKDMCDASISLDADLQDDISAIDEMIDNFYNGYDVVYGVRNNRDSDSFLKKATAQFYYKILKKMNKNIVYNHADFRLLGKDAMCELSKYSDSNLYLRGIIPTLKFKSTEVYYCRKRRELGKSKYGIKKMFQLAINGFINITTKPIRFFLVFGMLLLVINSFAALLYAVLYILNYINTLRLLPFLLIYLLISFVIFEIGVIGEYVGNIMVDFKKRPRYRIEEVIGNEK